MQRSKQIFWLIVIGTLIALISALHYTTPTMKWQYHLIFMQSYFIPILIAAFQFGVRGGLGSAIVISLIYFPHIVIHWGGLVDTNLMRFLQIVLFNVIGYLTGLKAQKEIAEKSRYQETSENLQKSMESLKEKSEQLAVMEEQVRLADRLAIVGELTASLAHEMRNPLGSIRGTVDILRNELPKESRQSEFFDILVKETNRLSAVVENYLGFTRTKKKEKSEFDFQEIIHQTVDLVRSRAIKSGIRIHLKLRDSPIIIWGDSSQLQQVIINLLLNALQAVNKDGEISISVAKVNGKSLNSTTDIDQSPVVQLTIADKGSGIEASELSKIFQPFYSTKADGTGLGLAVVKRIVDENHWKIHVESKVGEGTLFSLSIPVDLDKSLQNQTSS